MTRTLWILLALLALTSPAHASMLFCDITEAPTNSLGATDYLLRQPLVATQTIGTKTITEADLESPSKTDPTISIEANGGEYGGESSGVSVTIRDTTSGISGGGDDGNGAGYAEVFFMKPATDGIRAVCWLSDDEDAIPANPNPAGAPTRTATTGAVFVQSTANAKLGDAWRDPSGIVWGDVVKDSTGKPAPLLYADAVQACASIGARLPTEPELAMLGVYLGGTRFSKPLPKTIGESILDPATGAPSFYYIYDGYQPQVLPNLGDEFWGAATTGHGEADFFAGQEGGAVSHVTVSGFKMPARCVTGP